MARPKKTASYDAADLTIMAYFDQALQLKDSQKAASAEITALNSMMQDAGVCPGTLSVCCRLARMKPGKRGMSVALLHRYLQVLASRLEDPTLPTKPVEAEQQGNQAVPFGQRRTAAA